MRKPKWIALGGVLGVVSAVMVSLVVIFAPAAEGEPAPLLSESEAYEKALSEARFAGLQGDSTGYVAHRMTLGEYAAVRQVGLKPESAAVGLDPDLPVWVVTIHGKGVSALPGGPIPFADLTIVLDAKTGYTKSRSVYRLGFEPDFPVP